jgi:precorrin-6B methylase 2
VLNLFHNRFPPLSITLYVAIYLKEKPFCRVCAIDESAEMCKGFTQNIRTFSLQQSIFGQSQSQNRVVEAFDVVQMCQTALQRYIPIPRVSLPVLK